MTDLELMKVALAGLEYAADRIGCTDDDDEIGVARKALREKLAEGNVPLPAEEQTGQNPV